MARTIGPIRRAGAKIARFGAVLLLAVLLIILSETGSLTAVWSKVLHEAGFGLIVALLVWLLFEVQISMEQEQDWARQLERVTTNVFNAVLKKDLPKALLDEANSLILDSKLVREDFSVSYTLVDGLCDISPGIPAPCVLMRTEVRFVMRNISSEPQKYELAVSLPNPVHPNMKPLLQVHTIRALHHGNLVPVDMAKAEAAFRRALNQNQKTSIKFIAGEVTLAQNETLDFAAEYVMAKEVEDTEFLQTLYPCQGLSVRVTDRGAAGGRLVFARSVHRLDLEATASKVNPESRSLRIADYLLPHQGVLVWWKRTPEASISAAIGR